LHDAANRRSATTLWRDCVAELENGFTTEDIEFLFRMDRFYLGEAAPEGLPGGIDPKWSPGGLTNLLQVIGHFEAEIRFGTFSQTKKAMRDSLLQAFQAQVAAGDDDEAQAAAGDDDEAQAAAEDDEPREPDYSRWHYFSLMSRPDRDELDNALDQMFKLAEQEEAFWQDFRARVQESFQAEVRAQVSIELKSTTARLIVPLLQKHARDLEELCERGEDLVLPRPERFVFRKVGDTWKVRYEDRELPPLRDLTGYHHIAYLLAHPGQRIAYTTVQGDYRARKADPGSRSTIGAVQGRLTDVAQKKRGDIRDDKLDEEGVKDYMKRWHEIQDELINVRRDGDDAPIERLERERMDIERELEPVGIVRKEEHLVPRKRAGGSSDEKRAHDAVQNTIKESIQKIASKDERLGFHLKKSIRFGGSVSYEPENDVPWSL
jgi:hypothetical protein